MRKTGVRKGACSLLSGFTCTANGFFLRGIPPLPPLKPDSPAKKTKYLAEKLNYLGKIIKYLAEILL